MIKTYVRISHLIGICCFGTFFRQNLSSWGKLCCSLNHEEIKKEKIENKTVLTNQNSSTGWEMIPRKDETASIDKLGYLTAETRAYQFSHGLNHLFKIEQQIELTPGCAAIGSNYDKHWVGKNATVQNYFEPYTSQSHYGSFTTPTPKRLDYWPKNKPEFKTITSGFTIGLDWGKTSSIEIGAGTDGFGAKADGQFSSGFNIGYQYSETYTKSYPSIDAKKLENSNGYGMNITNLSGSGITEKTAIISSGMLFESKVADTTQGYDIYATFHTDVDFTIGAYLNRKTISYHKSFNLNVFNPDLS